MDPGPSVPSRRDRGLLYASHILWFGTLGAGFGAAAAIGAGAGTALGVALIGAGTFVGALLACIVSALPLWWRFGHHRAELAETEVRFSSRTGKVLTIPFSSRPRFDVTGSFGWREVLISTPASDLPRIRVVYARDVEPGDEVVSPPLMLWGSSAARFVQMLNARSEAQGSQSSG